VKSVRYAVVGTVGLAVLFAAIPVLSDLASNRPMAGQNLALGWRLAVWGALQITVLAPSMFALLALLALLGAWRSAPLTLAQERRLLGWWLLVGVVAWLAAIVVAVRVQSRLATSGARVRGWHVAAAAIPLLLLGEAALIPPAVVWWTSRRAV